MRRLNLFNKQIGDVICLVIQTMDRVIKFYFREPEKSTSTNQVLSNIVKDSMKLPEYLLSFLSVYGISFPYSLTVIMIVGFPVILKEVYNISSSFESVPSGTIILILAMFAFIAERTIFILTIAYARYIKWAPVRLIVIVGVLLLGIRSLFFDMSSLEMFVLIIVASYILSVISFLMFMDRELTNLASLILFYNISMPLFSREFYKWFFSSKSISWIKTALIKLVRRDKGDIYINSPLARYLVSIIELVGITVIWVIVISLVSILIFTMVTIPTSAELLDRLLYASLSNFIKFGNLVILILILIFAIEFFIFVRGILRVSCVIKNNLNNINLTITLGNTKHEVSFLKYLIRILSSLYAISLLGDDTQSEDQNRFVTVLLVSYLIGTISQIVYRALGKEVHQYHTAIFYYTISEFIKIPLILESTQFQDENSDLGKFEILERILWDHKLGESMYFLVTNKDVIYPRTPDQKKLLNGNDQDKSWVEVRYSLKSHEKA